MTLYLSSLSNCFLPLGCDEGKNVLRAPYTQEPYNERCYRDAAPVECLGVSRNGFLAALPGEHEGWGFHKCSQLKSNQRAGCLVIHFNCAVIL